MMAACGTLGGYSGHTRRREPICDECRAAWNTYMRDYRRTKHRGLAAARWQAIERLIAENSQRFNALLAEEMGESA